MNEQQKELADRVIRQYLSILDSDLILRCNNEVNEEFFKEFFTRLNNAVDRISYNIAIDGNPFTLKFFETYVDISHLVRPEVYSYVKPHFMSHARANYLSEK